MVNTTSTIEIELRLGDEFTKSTIPRIRILGEIVKEREDQIEKHGHTLDKDRKQYNHELLDAAAACALVGAGYDPELSAVRDISPWNDFPPPKYATDKRKACIVAAALILAHLELMEPVAPYSHDEAES